MNLFKLQKLTNKIILTSHTKIMKLSFGKKTIYGIGNLGYSVVSQTITNFFMFFGTSVLKVSGTLIGLAIALSTVWDAVTDPIVGYISDNKKLGVFGYRNGYMLIGTIGITICNLFIWCVPLNLNEWVKFVWVMLTLVLNETFCTLFSTPYGALCSDIVSDYDDRTIIQVFKTFFFLLGMILPSIMLYVFLPSTSEFPQGQLNPEGYKHIAIFTSLVMLVCGLVCTFGTLKLSKQSKTENLKNDGGIGQIFKGFVTCLKNEHLKTIILGYSLSMISAAILTSVGLHFFTYCFAYSSLKITILLSALLVGMLMGHPVWYKLSLKEDKKPALLSGLMVSIFGVIIIMLSYIFKSLLSTFSFYIILVAIFIVGFGAGTLYSLPSSMYMDAISYVNKTTNTNNSGTYQSFLTFSYNIANATALFVVGVLLDLIKFNPQLTNQTRPVQTGIAIILFVGVLISLIGSFCLFNKYKLKKKHFENDNEKPSNKQQN